MEDNAATDDAERWTIRSPLGPALDRLNGLAFEEPPPSAVVLTELEPQGFSEVDAVIRRWLASWQVAQVPGFVEDSHLHPPPPTWLAASPLGNRGFGYTGGISNDNSVFVLAYLRWRTQIVLPRITSPFRGRLYYRFRLHGRFRAGVGGNHVSVVHVANVGASSDVAVRSPFDDPTYVVWRRFGVQAELSGMGAGGYQLADSGNHVFEGSIAVRPGQTPALAIRLCADMVLHRGSWAMFYQIGGPNENWISGVDVAGDGQIEYRFVPELPGPILLSEFLEPRSPAVDLADLTANGDLSSTGGDSR